MHRFINVLRLYYLIACNIPITIHYRSSECRSVSSAQGATSRATGNPHYGRTSVGSPTMPRKHAGLGLFPDHIRLPRMMQIFRRRMEVMRHQTSELLIAMTCVSDNGVSMNLYNLIMMNTGGSSRLWRSRAMWRLMTQRMCR